MTEKKDLLLRDMVFIAEDRTTGERYEFTIFDLGGFDDGTVYITLDCEKGGITEFSLVAPAWDLVTDENPRFLFRLKRPDEDETGLRKAIRAVSARGLPGYRLEITYSNGKTSMTRDLSRWEMPVSPESSYPHKPFRELYTEEEFARITVTDRYIQWEDGRRMPIPHLPRS